jgi:hypothetical protein
MRRKYAVLLVCAAALVSTLCVTAAQASGYKHVSGEWTYVITNKLVLNEFNGYKFVYGEENGTWTGAFSGSSTDFFTLIKDSAFARCRGIIFFKGSVEDREGTLEIKFVGSKNLSTGLWLGWWLILDGTGELENLHGYGSWNGPSMDLDYSGKVRFR